MDDVGRRWAPEIERLFEAEYPRMVRTAYWIVRDRGIADEIAQESFARLVARWRRLRRYERPGAWLRTVTVRQAVRARDRRVRERALGGSEPAVGRAPAPVEQLDLLAALGELSRMQRAVVVLHYLHDLPVGAVARELRIEASTARAHLTRARRRLAELLCEPDEEVSHVD